MKSRFIKYIIILSQNSATWKTLKVLFGSHSKTKIRVTNHLIKHQNSAKAILIPLLALAPTVE